MDEYFIRSLAIAIRWESKQAGSWQLRMDACHSVLERLVNVKLHGEANSPV
jgi:hypothetical protein